MIQLYCPKTEICNKINDGSRKRILLDLKSSCAKAMFSEIVERIQDRQNKNNFSESRDVFLRLSLQARAAQALRKRLARQEAQPRL